jgi:hypothetical protein
MRWRAGGGGAMTRRRACPPAPGPPEDDAARCDDLVETRARRRGFRASRRGPLLPRERNKARTALAGAEPLVGARHPDVRRPQVSLPESPREPEALSARRPELLPADAPTRPRAGGVLVIDETGDRKDGTRTARGGPQDLGSRGEIEDGIVAVASPWADARAHYPLHARPHAPAARLPGGKADPAFRATPRRAVGLVDAAVGRGLAVRAVVAACLSGDNDAFADTPEEAGSPCVLGGEPAAGIRAAEGAIHSPQEAVRGRRWESAAGPGDRTPAPRHVRDGHAEAWRAAELAHGPDGPAQRRRMVVAATDPEARPDPSTRYLATNLPRPKRADLAEIPFAPADLAEVVRLCGLGRWVERGYRPVERAPGRADCVVRADPAIRRHRQPVRCAFAFCGRQWFERTAVPAPSSAAGEAPADRPAEPAAPPADPSAGGGGIGGPPSWPRAPRRVRAWPGPGSFPRRCRRAWSDRPPPPESQALLARVAAGRPLDLYLRE